MVHFLIAAHGRMASGIKASLDVLLGNSGQVEAFDAYVDGSNVEEELRRRVTAVGPEDSLVMMSDISGGSVNQMMMNYLNRENTFLVSGISLALVIGLVVSCTEQVTEAQIDALIEQSREMMVRVTLEETEEDEFF